MQQPIPDKPISVTIDRACEITGLGRTSLYDLLRTGRLRSITVGRRRLVVYASIEALIAPDAS